MKFNSPFNLVIIFSFVFVTLKSQETVDTNKQLIKNLYSDTILYESLPADVRKKHIVRQQSEDFFRTTLFLAEPSTISTKVIPFTEKTWNSDTGLQKKPFLLNADIQTPIGLGGPRWNIRGVGIISSIHLVPQFKVRILDNDKSRGDSSRPVRTPSYLPRATLYLTHKNLWRKNSTSHLFGFSAFHHSNGQDGNEFNDDGSINTYNGNFGEQVVFDFIYSGINTKEINRLIVRDSSTIKRELKGGAYYAESKRVVRDIYWRAVYELHTKSLTNQDILPYNLYGRHRLNLQLAYVHSPIYSTKVQSSNGRSYYVSKNKTKELFRILLNTQIILDKEYNLGDMNNQTSASSLIKDRLNIYLTAYMRIRGTPNSAVFIQFGHWASDNYNIYFQQSIWHFRAGIALGYFKYPKNS